MYYLSSNLSSVIVERCQLSSRLSKVEVEKDEKERVIHEKDRIITEKDVQLQQKEKEIRDLWVKNSNNVQELVCNINQKDRQYRNITEQRDLEIRELRSKHTADISTLRDEIDHRNAEIESKMKMYDNIVKGIRSFCRVLQANGNPYLMQVAYEEMGRHVDNYTSIGLEWSGNNLSQTPSSPSLSPVSAPVQQIVESPASVQPVIDSTPSNGAADTITTSTPLLRIRKPKKAPSI